MSIEDAMAAAWAADLAWVHSPDRERGGSWGAVPEPQLRRLLEAAAPHLAHEAADGWRAGVLHAARLAEREEATYLAGKRPCGCDPACKHFDYDELPFAALLRDLLEGTPDAT